MSCVYMARGCDYGASENFTVCQKPLFGFGGGGVLKNLEYKFVPSRTFFIGIYKIIGLAQTRGLNPQSRMAAC